MAKKGKPLRASTTAKLPMVVSKLKPVLNKRTALDSKRKLEPILKRRTKI